MRLKEQPFTVSVPGLGLGWLGGWLGLLGGWVRGWLGGRLREIGHAYVVNRSKEMSCYIKGNRLYICNS